MGRRGDRLYLEEMPGPAAPGVHREERPGARRRPRFGAKKNPGTTADHGMQTGRLFCQTDKRAFLLE